MVVGYCLPCCFLRGLIHINVGLLNGVELMSEVVCKWCLSVIVVFERNSCGFEYVQDHTGINF